MHAVAREFTVQLEGAISAQRRLQPRLDATADWETGHDHKMGERCA
jgi:hypothetical protein